MYLLDTNIFLEILLNQEQESFCRKVLDRLDGERPGRVTAFSLHAIEAIISRSGNYALLGDFLESCKNHLFLSCYETSLEEEEEIAHLAPKVGLDFDDALQYYVARKERLALVTLDQDFKKVRDIKVISPKEFEL